MIRYSGSELILRRLTEMGAIVRMHDPHVDSWAEIEGMEDDPEASKGYARFISRQKNLERLRVESDLWAAMKGVKAIVIVVPHRQYRDLDPEKLVEAGGRPCAIVDCFCILDDARIVGYLELGCEVKGLGRGHIRRLKDGLRGPA